ncbi:hypothetical protein [Qipengyuania zhejiangensis]|uniref:hypothetical protein n=1 Tax=Qipengyuania zhejiangensis TaxID=3077782 RepID=UPI002D79A19C|nr:hypothetical protein [Qipengyuania sp. Z2]
MDLQHLSVALGNAALQERKNWPSNGDGRLVKATTEKILRSLERAFERGDINFALDIIEESIMMLTELSDIPFYSELIADKKHRDRTYNLKTFRETVSLRLPIYSKYIASNRPPRKLAPTPIEAQEDLPDVSKIIPAQKSAPLKFAVANGMLQLKRQSARISADDRQMVSHGRSALQDDATSIIHSLAGSNADPRFLVAFGEIRDVLAADSDVIRLGMLSVSCNSLVSRFHEQLPDIVSARLDAFDTNLSMFVSQFPDWRKFVENASSTEELSSDEIQVVFNVGQELAEKLQTNEELVDPSVPKSLKLILEAIRDPSKASKRAVFGAVRTLENLIGTIILGFGGFFGAGFAGVKDGLKASSKIAAIALILGLAANSAEALSPSAAKMVKSDWMEKAASAIKKAMES